MWRTSGGTSWGRFRPATASASWRICGFSATRRATSCPLCLKRCGPPGGVRGGRQRECDPRHTREAKYLTSQILFCQEIAPAAPPSTAGFPAANPTTSKELFMSTLDFPAGSKNKPATLVTGEREALLVDAGFTRADGHRLAAAVLDSGKTLTTVFISHGDPDFYFGAEVLADAFPTAVFTATPPAIEHIQHSYEGKLKAWAGLGANLPTRLVDLVPLSGDLNLEGQRFELKGGPAELPDRHYLWQPEHRAIVGGVLVFAREHVWT